MKARDQESDPLDGIRSLIAGRSDQEIAILVAAMMSAATHTAAALDLAALDEPKYIPHPLDVLIFAVIEQRGALHRVDILAELDGDTYRLGKESRKITNTSLKNRLPELVNCGVLWKTANGYALRWLDAIAIADKAFPD